MSDADARPPLQEVRRAEGERGKDWFKIRDLLADGRCSQAVLDFLSTDAGRLVLTERDAGSSGSSGSEKRKGAEVEELGAGGGGTAFPLDALLHGGCGRGVGDWSRFPLFFPLHSLCDLFSLVRLLFSWDKLGWMAKGCAASRGQQTGNLG